MKKNLAFYIFIFLYIHSYSQPIQGCYLGAYLGCGNTDISCISPHQFNVLTGKNHYTFSHYINANDITDLLNTSHWLWADTLKAIGAKPVFFLMPYGNLQDYYNGNKDAFLNQFAQLCANFQDTVYLIFGHEMNGSWYPWGQDSTNYKLAFNHVSSLVKTIAPKTRFCWVAAHLWGASDYAPYYPGNATVDWVGLTLYDRDWDENNILGSGHIKAMLEASAFYQQFSQVTAKPMMIAETGYFDANQDPTSAGVRNPLSDAQQMAAKNQWIAQLYYATLLANQFPNLNMILYFQVQKQEPDFTSQNHFFGAINADWRIPLQSGFNNYSNLIANPYFHGASPVGINENKTNIENKAWLKVYPNPAKDYITIEYYLPVKDSFQIYIASATGQKIVKIKEGIDNGKSTISYFIDSMKNGIYYMVIETNLNKKVQEKLILIK